MIVRFIAFIRLNFLYEPEDLIGLVSDVKICFICSLLGVSSSSIFYFSASVFPHADTSAVRSQDTPLCHTLRILFPPNDRFPSLY